MISVKLEKKLDGAGGSLHLDVKFPLDTFATMALMGPSGSGKTSILRMLAGLMKPDKGYIQVNSDFWFDSEKKVFRKVQQRDIGFLFQNYALFPNMTVRENLLFALPLDEEKKKVEDLLDTMGLVALADKKPNYLSGGQQQRVALARAVVRKPKLLLLDEPLSALDQGMREKLQKDLKLIHQEFKTTTILVTHDPVEAARLADKVLVLEDGKIKRFGPPDMVLFKHHSLTDGLPAEILTINPEERIMTVMMANNIFSVPYQPLKHENLKAGDTLAFYADQIRLEKPV